MHRPELHIGYALFTQIVTEQSGSVLWCHQIGTSDRGKKLEHLAAPAIAEEDQPRKL